MSNLIRIALEPAGKTIAVPGNASLQDVLFEEGVEFPCGGQGRCGGCKIRLLKGSLPVTEDDVNTFSASELNEGWRLACRARATADITLELAQWETPILSSHAQISNIIARNGLGIAVDLGTTTLAAQLIDLQNNHVLGTKTELNAQARLGADVMSRIEAAVVMGRQQELRRIIVDQIGCMATDLLNIAGKRAREINRIVIAGNTVMHHLFCGEDATPLSHTPFESNNLGIKFFHALELQWPIPTNPEVWFLPCLGGFVGSDILAGILATGLHKQPQWHVLIDLGTNGEIVLGNKDRILCASTAAGPAFEGARINMGMRAATGAISKVKKTNESWECHVLGETAPKGICGSGLVDAVATGLDCGIIQPNGRFTRGQSWPLLHPVTLFQGDIRQLQLAKGAIAAGLRILLSEAGTSISDIQQVHLAGAFGNYIDRNSAKRIGLLDFPLEKVEPSGNTSLAGAKLALYFPDALAPELDAVLKLTRHIALHENPLFQDIYVEEMLFPGA